VSTVLITGANRGVGLALTQAYAQIVDTTVIAACRNPEKATELRSTANTPESSIDITRLDVNSPSSIDQCVAALTEKYDSLDTLINNAGVFGGSVPEPMDQTARFGSLGMDEMLDVFRTNTVAPVLMAQACLHLLRKGTNTRIINISSDAGSITLRENKGNYTYMASKAGLNMMTRCIAAELRDEAIVAVSMHPGFLRTDMGGAEAPMSLEETIPSLIQQIEGLSMADTGRFINWDGATIPW
jgi:NAD(P)-dependent dehydrogenase (short-subunit alcohol dehydrogenase family)